MDIGNNPTPAAIDPNAALAGLVPTVRQQTSEPQWTTVVRGGYNSNPPKRYALSRCDADSLGALSGLKAYEDAEAAAVAALDRGRITPSQRVELAEALRAGIEKAVAVRRAVPTLRLQADAQVRIADLATILDRRLPELHELLAELSAGSAS